MRQLIPLFFILTLLFYKGQSHPTDTIGDTNKSEIYSELISNLDSLANLWYVKHSEAYKTTTSIEKSDSAEIPVFDDEVYRDRLKSISSIINLPYNDKVKAFINLYVVKRRDIVEVMLGLSNYYFPVFEEILDKEGLPNEFKYLPLIESALNPRAVSRAGATGMWQFMFTTARLYGLEINSFVDERRDPVKATYAAAAFLKDLYDLYGDWTLALTAYNCGPGNVNKAIRRSKGKTDFWDLYYYLPRETRGYVPSFIAAVYFMNFYAEHELSPIDITMPDFTDTIMVDQELHLKQVSDVLQIDIQLLRDMNPQYRTDIIPAKTKEYPLRLPVNMAARFIDLSDSIYAYKDSFFFNPAREVLSPPKNKVNRSYTPAPPGKNMTALYYTIQPGDNLGYISQWYHVRLTDLRYWNNIRGNTIRAGQKLLVYVPSDKSQNYERINNMSFKQKQESVGIEVAPKPVQKTKQVKTTKSNGKFTTYKVRSGDNPWVISKKFPGVSPQEILDANGIKDARNLRPGQILKIPVK